MGRVVRVEGSIVRVAELDAAMGDVVAVGAEARAIVTALERSEVVAAVLRGAPRAGDDARSIGALEVPGGPATAGRALDPLGRARDGRSELDGPRRRVNARPPRLAQRVSASMRIATGVKALDLLYPMMAGERVLLAGAGGPERFALLSACAHAVCGVRGKPWEHPWCVFVSFHGATLEGPHVTSVVVEPTDPPALRVLAVASALAIAERVREDAGHALVLIDDLRAWERALRDHVPGVTPAEIFSAFAVVLDRAGAFERGSISIIAADDEVSKSVSHLHPVGIFDRGVLLEAGRPSIPATLSKFVPSAALRGFVPAAGRVRMGLARWSELVERIHGFSFIDRSTFETLRYGERLRHLLAQRLPEPFPAADLVLLVHAYASSVIESLALSELDDFDAQFLARARQEGLALEPDQRPTDEEMRAVRTLAMDVARAMRERSASALIDELRAEVEGDGPPARRARAKAELERMAPRTSWLRRVFRRFYA